jgi:polyhydroxybutyrate depolymerase
MVKRWWLLAVGMLLIGLLGFGPGGHAAAQGPEEGHTLVHQGIERHYLLHVPDAVRYPAPLVIVLHGGGGNAAQIRADNHFDRVADEHGFIAVYPEGVDHFWNDGAAFRASEVDDVGFIAALIDAVSAEQPVDPARVYATGISNGGFMSLHLACALSDRITAIAAVTSSLRPFDQVPCQPDQPVGVLIMNGTDDPLVPYDGGTVTVLGTQRGEVLSTDETVAFWVQTNGCQDSPREVALRNTALLDGTRVFRTAYTECAMPVTRYRVQSGGHTWPGARPSLVLGPIVGRTSHDIDASEVIGDFFAGISR